MATWTKEVVDLSVAGSSLTVDSIKIDGTNIGHTDDTDLLSLTSGTLTVNGALALGGTLTGVTTLATSGDATVGGNLTITGNILTFGNGEIVSNVGDETMTLSSPNVEVNAIAKSSTASLRISSKSTYDSQLLFREVISSKWSIANDATNDNLTIDAGTATVGSATKLSLDTSGNMVIAGDLTVTGGDIDLSGEASTITLVDNTASAFIIGSPGKTDLFTINTNDSQETVAIDADRTSHTNLISGGLTLSATGSGITGNQTDSNLGGIYFKAPTFINQSGSNTIGQHSYLKIDDANITNVSGTATITNVCLLDLENNLGTSNSCTTNSDKTGNAKSGTIKVNVNGTIYHIQLYAN